MRMSTRENIGWGIDQRCSTDPRRHARGAHPQNIDGEFIQGRKAFFSQASIERSFDSGLPEAEPARKNHRYVSGVDPALTLDSTWAIVLDTTDPSHIRGVYVDRHRGRTTGPVIAALTTAAHQAYNAPGISVCETGIDATGFGGKMFRDLLYSSPLRSVEFGGTRGKKLRLLNSLRRRRVGPPQAAQVGRLAVASPTAPGLPPRRPPDRAGRGHGPGRRGPPGRPDARGRGGSNGVRLLPFRSPGW
jgi:hypothetical protein